MIAMYKGQQYSPQLKLTNAIDEVQTTIQVTDDSYDGTYQSLPLPNVFVIGGDKDYGETILVTAIIKLASNLFQFTVQRGWKGASSNWDANTNIGRNFTAYDYNTLVDNVNELEADKLDKTSVVNNLTTTSTTSALSANQGKILNDGKVNISDIVDNLSSTSGVVPLSANQGRVLFQYANDGKTNIAGVIGSPALSSNSFTTLKNYIQNNKNTMASNLTAKGVSSLGTDTLANLASKIGNIETKTVASGTMSLTFGTSSPAIDYDKYLGWRPSFVSYAMVYSYNNHTYTAMYDSYSKMLSLSETRTSEEALTYVGVDLILSTGFNVDITFHWCDSTAQENIKGKTVTVKYYAVK